MHVFSCSNKLLVSALILWRVLTKEFCWFALGPEQIQSADYYTRVLSLLIIILTRHKAVCQVVFIGGKKRATIKATLPLLTSLAPTGMGFLRKDREPILDLGAPTTQAHAVR